jgi:hypothetical protein
MNTISRQSARATFLVLLASSILLPATARADTTPAGLYQAWISSHPGASGTGHLLEDADSDHFKNLAEYAFGSVPDNPASLPENPRIEQAPDGSFLCVFRRRKDAAARGLHYAIQFTENISDPASWSAANVAESSVSPIDEHFELVRATLPSGENHPHGFARSRVEFSPLASLTLSPASHSLSTDSLVNFDLSGANLISNGSFELGLGAEPVYPGWIQTEPGASLTPPGRPLVTPETASHGNRCLKIPGIVQGQRVVIDFKPPPMGTSGTTSATLALDVKSDKGTMSAIMPGFASHSVSTAWQRFSRTIQVDAAYPVLRVDFTNNGPEPATLFVDGISWTADNSAASSFLRSSAVEASLLPASRDGIHDSTSHVLLSYALDAQTPTQAVLELHLRDLTRGGTATIPWTRQTTIPDQPAGGSIDLGTLPPGAYMALLGVRNPGDDTILAVAREKFTVMSPLVGIDPPIGFSTGMHGGVRGFSGQTDFCARGAWSLDEYYQTAWRIGLRTQRLVAEIFQLMPQPGTTDLSTLKPYIDTAVNHGCNTVLCADTFRYKNQGSTAPSGHDGDWVFVQGTKAPDDVDSPAYDFYIIPPDAIASLYGALGSEFDGKLAALEIINELNMYIKHDHMSWIVDNLYRPAYQAFKPNAPTTPVVVNFTMDFYLTPGYTQGFFSSDGAEGTDGFSYHPYARRILVENLNNGTTGYGFDYMDRNNTFKTEAEATTTKTIHMGMSEIHAIGTYFTPGWDLMQRTLIDWSGGADWSAGVLSDGLYFLEAREMSAWVNRGPRAPGTGAVALNAMHAILGGFRLLERINLDHGILLALFENPATGETAAAMANGYYETKDATLDVAISSMAYQAYDQWGAETTVSAPLNLSREILYIKSADPDFAEAFRNATLHLSTVSPRPQYAHDPGQFSPSPDKAWYAELLRTGLPPMQ